MPDLWTEEEADKVADRMKRRAAAILAAYGALMPVAHILGNRDPHSLKEKRFQKLLGLVIKDESGKAVEEVLLEECRRCDASAIILVMERDAIESQEAVIVTLEHGRRYRFWEMIFTRNAANHPVLGTWEEKASDMKGRFAGLLTGARGS